ncbi:MAG: PilZ domain-containing protein [Nitrospirota bacterium]|nr:MAG: PilZ domain-containing protein [Nitrospirota bacterium]
MATRQHIRIKKSGVVDIWSKSDGKIDEIFGALKMAFCLIKDISLSGLGLFSTTPLNEGDTVSIKRINFNKRIYHEHITGKVVWVSGKEKAYHIGIEFENIISGDKYPKIYSGVFSHSELHHEQV